MRRIFFQFIIVSNLRTDSILVVLSLALSGVSLKWCNIPFCSAATLSLVCCNVLEWVIFQINDGAQFHSSVLWHSVVGCYNVIISFHIGPTSCLRGLKLFVFWVLWRSAAVLWRSRDIKFGNSNVSLSSWTFVGCEDSSLNNLKKEVVFVSFN